MIQIRSMCYQRSMSMSMSGSRTKCHNDTMSLIKYNLKEIKNG